MWPVLAGSVGPPLSRAPVSPRPATLRSGGLAGNAECPELLDGSPAVSGTSPARVSHPLRTRRPLLDICASLLEMFFPRLRPSSFGTSQWGGSQHLPPRPPPGATTVGIRRSLLQGYVGSWLPGSLSNPALASVAGYFAVIPPTPLASLPPVVPTTRSLPRSCLPRDPTLPPPPVCPAPSLPFPDPAGAQPPHTSRTQPCLKAWVQSGP